MVRVTNPSHVKAARLRESGIEWSIALVKAKVPGTDLTRKSVRRIIRELVSTAKAEAQAERDAADAEVWAKRKDLEAREAVLKLAGRKAIPKRCFEKSLHSPVGSANGIHPSELFFDPARQQRVLDPALMSMPTSSMV